MIWYNWGNSKEWTGDVGASRPMALSPKEAKMHSKSIPTLTTEQQVRFWSKVDVHQPAACWEWTGYIHHGYGYFGLNGRQFRAHRISYSLLIGEIPTELVIDHLCKNKRCVNPDHLRAVPQSENVIPAMRSKTHCKNGHKYSPETTTMKHHTINGSEFRVCRICRRKWNSEYKKRRRDRNAGR